MAHRAVRVFLVLGVLLGLTLGFCELGGPRHSARHAEFENHIADLCVRAALRAAPFEEHSVRPKSDAR